MIHDLDETLKDILQKRGGLNGGDIDIAFDQPTGEWAAGLNRPTVNFYLYDIRENTELRARQPRVQRRQDGTAQTVFPPKRIDLSYLITVWARNPEDEHQLLWRVLGTLAKLKYIEPEDGKGSVQRQPARMPTEVALPSEALRNMPDLWGVMENQLKPSINFQVTVALDLDEVFEAPMVFTSTFRIGQADGNREELRALSDEIYHIGGHVHKGDDIIPDAQVTLLDSGDSVTTDGDGRYVFAYMREGKYQLEVQAAGQKTKKFEIEVPADNYDLSL
jgi:hypothetical protein